MAFFGGREARYRVPGRDVEEARTLLWKLRFHYEGIRERMSTFIKSLTTKDARTNGGLRDAWFFFFPRRVFTRD